MVVEVGIPGFVPEKFPPKQKLLTPSVPVCHAHPTPPLTTPEALGLPCDWGAAAIDLFLLLILTYPAGHPSADYLVIYSQNY